MGVVQRGRSARDLLAHVALNETEEFRREIEEVRDDGVHGDKIEVELRVRIGDVVRCDGGGAVTRTHVVEVTEATELVVNLAHDADLVRGLLRGWAAHVHVLLRHDGKEEWHVCHLATNQLQLCDLLSE